MEPSAPERLRVVIADDHPSYRAGIARILDRSGFDVVAEEPNGDAAIQAAAALHPDVVVLDLNMPGLPGPEAIRRLTECEPATPVVVLSVSADELDVTDAVLAGASGYVLKDGPPDDLIAAIHAAATGQHSIPSNVAATLVRRLRETIDPADDGV